MKLSESVNIKTYVTKASYISKLSAKLSGNVKGQYFFYFYGVESKATGQTTKKKGMAKQVFLAVFAKAKKAEWSKLLNHWKQQGWYISFTGGHCELVDGHLKLTVSKSVVAEADKQVLTKSVSLEALKQFLSATTDDTVTLDPVEEEGDAPTSSVEDTPTTSSSLSGKTAGELLALIPPKFDRSSFQTFEDIFKALTTIAGKMELEADTTVVGKSQLYRTSRNPIPKKLSLVALAKFLADKEEEGVLGMSKEAWAEFLRGREESKIEELEEMSDSIQDRQEKGHYNERQESEAPVEEEEVVEQEVMEEVVVEEEFVEVEEDVIEAAPDFGKHFEDTSIGIESELSGVCCALPVDAVQKFGWIKSLTNGSPLLMITKDMNTGAYGNPKNHDYVKVDQKWRTNTVELVSYPSKKNDPAATKEHNDAMLWFANYLKHHISNKNHEPLSGIKSKDGRFLLVVSNRNHVVAGGNGASLVDEYASVSMGGQQATMGVKAKDFGSGSSPELKMLEAAPWYNKAYLSDGLISPLSGQAQDHETVKKVYAYLKSILSYAGELALDYGLFFDGWDPGPKGDNVAPRKEWGAGLTDPKVKNEWSILPRTNPSEMLKFLKGKDKPLVTALLKNNVAAGIPPKLWKALYAYFIMSNGGVAGHGINDATIGDSQSPEPAMLFEFRSIPDSLSEHAPKIGIAKVEKLTVDQFTGEERTKVVRAINKFINESGDGFDEWYTNYREESGKSPSKRPPKSLASINEKAAWIQEAKPTEWEEIISFVD